jgi:hypothetical protein
MPQLRVSNGFVKQLVGLGSTKPSIFDLDAKTVTMKVRAALQHAYDGDSNVCVSCSATKIDRTHWRGTCCIRQDGHNTRCQSSHCSHRSKEMLTPFEYHIFPDPD